VLGINAGSALVSPRCLYALAQAGYLPRPVAWVHPVRKTPVTAIVITGALSLGLALSGTFEQLAVISVVARFAQYIPTCLALPVLRRRGGALPGFRAPAGTAIALVSVGLCLWLLAVSDPMKIVWGLVATASGLLVYWPYRWASRQKN
jgi:amino acid transporter